MSLQCALDLIDAWDRLPLARAVGRQKDLPAEERFRQERGLSKRDVSALLVIKSAMLETCQLPGAEPDDYRLHHTFVDKKEKLVCKHCGLILDIDRFERGSLP